VDLLFFLCTAIAVAGGSVPKYNFLVCYKYYFEREVESVGGGAEFECARGDIFGCGRRDTSSYEIGRVQECGREICYGQVAWL